MPGEVIAEDVEKRPVAGGHSQFEAAALEPEGCRCWVFGVRCWVVAAIWPNAEHRTPNTDRLLQLCDEPGFAHAGLADQRDRLPLALRETLQRLLQPGKLFVP